MISRFNWEIVRNQISLLPCIGIVKHRGFKYKYSICFFFLKFRCRFYFCDTFKCYKELENKGGAE